MARTPKRGIDYAGWSVNVFDGDKKIDKLLDAQGWKGFGVYFFLCQSAYKMNGYYLEWDYDDCASTARKMGGGIGSETVMETVKLCLLVGLFDNGLFDRWGVLTSKGIQRRFWAAAGERREVHLDSRFWLLAPEDAEGLNKRSRFENLPPQKAITPPQKAITPRRNDTKVKESKAKQSKGKSLTPQNAAQDGTEDQTELPFDGELREAVFDWLAYKKERRESYKPTGLKSLISRIQNYANQFGDTETAGAIRDSMASNYAGIVFDRIGRTSGGSHEMSNTSKTAWKTGEYGNGYFNDDD